MTDRELVPREAFTEQEIEHLAAVVRDGCGIATASLVTRLLRAALEAKPVACLSERLRPNCEAAPWVIDGVRKLEQRIAELESQFTLANEAKSSLREQLAAANEARQKAGRTSYAIAMHDAAYLFERLPRNIGKPPSRRGRSRHEAHPVHCRGVRVADAQQNAPGPIAQALANNIKATL
jgi:hypothetical protein